MSQPNEHKYVTELKNTYNIDTIVGYKNEQVHDVYIDSMDDKVKLAMSIAVDHLGSSFHLTKSNGYLQYNKRKKKS
jgi:hypothetical protein